MLKSYRSVRSVAREIASAADGALRDYQFGDTEYETDFTGRMIGAIRDRLRTVQLNGIDWRVRSLRTGAGKGAEEKRHGPDLLGVLNIDVRGYRTKKGFLAQAKRAEPSEPLSKARWQDLVGQCEAMLNRTPDSFVFAYSGERGIRIFPANAVVAADTRQIFDLYDHGMADFFESYIECFIGDLRLNSTDIGVLDAIAGLPVEHVMELIAGVVPQ